jgi:hypothetical protein
MEDDMGQNSADAAPLIVEFPLEGGVRAIARTPADLAAKSSEVIDEAMGTISEMSSRFRRTVEQMPVRPSQIELSFGIKLSAEVGAIVSKVGGEAALGVRLVWGDAG